MASSMRSLHRYAIPTSTQEYSRAVADRDRSDRAPPYRLMFEPEPDKAAHPDLLAAGQEALGVRADRDLNHRAGIAVSRIPDPRRRVGRSRANDHGGSLQCRPTHRKWLIALPVPTPCTVRTSITRSKIV